jgi:hypothetical protein
MSQGEQRRVSKTDNYLISLNISTMSEVQADFSGPKGVLAFPGTEFCFKQRKVGQELANRLA